MIGKNGNSLKQRLIFTGLIIFTLVLIAAIALFLTARQYNFYIERSSHAQHVYSSYRAVSDHTYRKLSALAKIVEEGTLINLQERYRNKEALRAALQAVRDSIAIELTHVGDASEAEELAHFNKIELVAEEIIRGSELVRGAVSENDVDAAKRALDNLRSQEIEGKFVRLIDEALTEEQRESRETQRVAQELNTILTRLLYFILVCFVLSAGYLLYTIWRALNHALREVEKAGTAYREGDFSHKVPERIELEFQGVAVALNDMSSEIYDQRKREKNTQENLEAIIDKRTRELRSSNQKLEEVGEARKQFLADISHELRTPLTIMQGEADFALRGESKTTEQYVDALSRIKEQIVHTTRFVQDLLFVARADDGKAPLHKRPTSLQPVLEEVCRNFAIIAAEKEIQIIEDYPDNNLIASVDESKFKQVITILMDNAIRYSYNQSTVKVCLEDNRHTASISVIDNGIGLEYNEANQIFSRFYRGSAGSRSASGTGLGLPVAKAIIDAHGGGIDLSGDKKRGTIATVTLLLDVKLRAVK